MIEQKRHIDAYYYWFNLTEKGLNTSDAIIETANHFQLEKRTIWKYYSEFNWKERAITKRQEIVKEVEKKENKTLAENRVQYLRILHKLLDEYVKAGLPSKIESVKDLEIIIKNCLILQDSPSEVTKQKNTTDVNVNVNPNELFDEELMQKIIEEEKNNTEDYDSFTITENIEDTI